jgi:hypothetical protein
MRPRILAYASISLMALGLAACHHDRTVVVEPSQPAASGTNTVVVPQNTAPQPAPQNNTVITPAR